MTHHSPEALAQLRKDFIDPYSDDEIMGDHRTVVDLIETAEALHAQNQKLRGVGAELQEYFANKKRSAREIELNQALKQALASVDQYPHQ